MYESLYRKGAPLTEQETADIKSKLTQMATFVSFKTRDIEDGLCEPLEDVRTESISGPDQRPWQGTASEITLSQQKYDKLCELYDTTTAASCDLDKDALLSVAFGAAVTICHELAHALCFARFDHDAIVVGFEDQCYNEEGFSWEACVFGGNLHVDEETALLQSGWGPSDFEHYMHQHNDDSAPMFVVRPPEQDVEVRWH